MFSPLLAVADKSELVRGFNEKIEEALPGSGGISGLFGWAIGIGGMLAFGILVYAGILYIASGAIPSKQSEAKDWMRAALSGLVLLMMGYVLLRVINPELLKY